MIDSKLHIVRRHSWFFFALLCMSTLWATSSYRFAWDDAHLAHRALAFWSYLREGDFTGMHAALGEVSKSPIFPLLTIPWAWCPVPSVMVGLILFTSLIIQLAAMIYVGLILQRLNVPLLVSVGAGLVIALSGTLATHAGLFLVDALLAWVFVVLGVQVLGTKSEAGMSTKALAGRYIIFGCAVCIGLLSKVTFVVLGGGLLISWAAAVQSIFGFKGLLRRFLIWGPLTAPGIVVWFFYGSQFIAHAKIAAYGPIADKYGPGGSDPILYFSKLFQENHLAAYILLPLTVVCLVQAARKRIGFQPLCVVGVAAAYLALCAISSNHDLRLSLPSIVALPILLVAATPWPSGTTNHSREGVLVVLLLGTLSLIPTAFRSDLSEAISAQSVLRQVVESGANSAILITDSGPRNIETLLLSRQLERSTFIGLKVDTIAYDEMRQRPVEYTVQRCLESDAIIYETILPSTPDFTNTRTETVLQALGENKDRKMLSNGAYTLVLRIKP